MASLSAGHCVAHTTELLENILVHVVDDLKKPYQWQHEWGQHQWEYDYAAFVNEWQAEQHELQREENYKALLFSQRVCRQFRDTIRGSPELSRALYLSPTPGKYKPTTTMNRLLPILSSSDLPTIKIDGFEFDVEIAANLQEAWVTFRVYSSGARMLPPRTQGCWREMYIWDCDYKVTVVQRWRRSLGLTKETHYGKWESPTLGELFDVAFPETAMN